MPRANAKAPARTTAKRATRGMYDKASSRRIPPQVDPDKPSLKSTARIVKGTSVAKVNWQAAANAFEPISANQVVATVTKLEIKDPKECQKDADGNFFNARGEQKYQYINVEWTVPEGEDNQGRKVFGIWSLSPKALWRLKQDAIAMGVDPDVFEYDENDPEAGEMDIETDLLPKMAGCTAILELIIEEYTTNDGKTKKKNVITGVQEITVGSRR